MLNREWGILSQIWILYLTDSDSTPLPPPCMPMACGNSQAGELPQLSSQFLFLKLEYKEENFLDVAPPILSDHLAICKGQLLNLCIIVFNTMLGYGWSKCDYSANTEKIKHGSQGQGA